MKLQKCWFKHNENSPWEWGVARVKEFGVAEVLWIISENNVMSHDPWEYRLKDGPLSHIDTEYLS